MVPPFLNWSTSSPDIRMSSSSPERNEKGLIFFMNSLGGIMVHDSEVKTGLPRKPCYILSGGYFRGRCGGGRLPGEELVDQCLGRRFRNEAASNVEDTTAAYKYPFHCAHAEQGRISCKHRPSAPQGGYGAVYHGEDRAQFC